jgi:Xaa-Pro aminopeptidase
MIKPSDYAQRRKKLMRRIGRKGIVILPSAREVYRNGDAAYAYRQHSDFYYLTGFEEPEAVLVLAPDRKEGEYILFNRERNPQEEVWDGPRAGQTGAVKHFHADQSFPISQFIQMLPALLAGRETIHYSLGMDDGFDKIMLDAVNQLRGRVRSGMISPMTFADTTLFLHEMRLFKSDEEVAVMQKAIDVTGDAHVRAMRACKPGMYEYELEAEIMYEFLRQGVHHPAYTSIVGAGKNTCVLHYILNNQKISAEDLVLIDAGAEFENYAADITRTFPASGKFSGEQRAIYELVLAAQLAAIKKMKPGASWEAAQNVIVNIITQGLLDLKILKGNFESLIEKQAYLPFYMHKSGHWLGLDVHDVGRYQVDDKWRSLQSGMVFTVEPGIYLSSSIPGLSERWHNIGVRIEDDVLVTDKGCKVLSEKIPKTITDIEAVMAG